VKGTESEKARAGRKKNEAFIANVSHREKKVDVCCYFVSYFFFLQVLTVVVIDPYLDYVVVVVVVRDGKAVALPAGLRGFSNVWS